MPTAGTIPSRIASSAVATFNAAPPALSRPTNPCGAVTGTGTGRVPNTVRERARLQRVQLGNAGAVGEDQVDVVRRHPGVGERAPHGPRVLLRVRRRILVVVRVVRRGVPGDLAVDLRRAALARRVPSSTTSTAPPSPGT